MYAQAIDPTLAAEECFHCGLPLGPGKPYVAAVDGEPRSLCCRGCQAVTQAIVDAGLADYYHHRTAASASQRESVVPVELRLFDLPEVQKTFVRARGAREKEAALLLEGITCAACVWLIENRIGALRGVVAIDINYATRRARVAWDCERTELSSILNAIGAIGYRAHPYDAARSDDLLRRERKAALWGLFVAGFGMMQVMMYAAPLYLADGDMSGDIELMMRWASLILTAPVVFYSAGPIFAGASRDLKALRIGMDVPVALGIGAAFAASVWATITTSGEVYFDSITMFVFLLLGARFLESGARAKAAQATDELIRLVPAIAERIPRFPASRETEQVAVARLVPGDHALVRPGAPIPADGVLIEGEGRVDEALLTGESLPVTKRAGDRLIGGALNVASPVIMRIDRVGQDTVLAAIVRLLDRAMAEKPLIAQLADRVAQRFLAVLLFAAGAIGLVWYWIDPARALWVTISVLVVTCPCALSLATPAAVAAVTGRLARRGMFITRGHALETLARATHFVLDKTGTLTYGRPALTEVRTLGALPRERCLALATALEMSSEHPLSRPLREIAPKGQSVSAYDIVSTPGRGIEGTVEGRRVRIGTPAFVAELAGEFDAGALEPSDERASVVALGDGSGWLAVFAFDDAIRSDARDAVRKLIERGKVLYLVSGDRADAARRVAHEVGIAGVIANASPQDKLDFLSRLQSAGHVVAVVGDGVNDAPMLAAASVSVAMGRGTDIARASADAILLSDRLDGLPEAVDLAAKTMRIIRQNLAWAFAYNVVALPLAMLGHVTPWMAALGMAGSSFLVVANALRLSRSEHVPSKAGLWKFSTC
jgi:Cu2+-exporting ATPase